MIEHRLILWPMAVLAALTFFVLSLMPMFRVGDTMAGRTQANDFKYGESDKVPEKTRLYNRNYMNLLELPVLFYVVCGILYMTDTLTRLELYLAWGFVAFRALHTVMHLTANWVLGRMALFGGSVVCVMAMWLITFWNLAVA